MIFNYDVSGLEDALNDRIDYAFEVSAYREPGTTATLRSYSVGDYVIVNDRLWKVTNAIPLGSQFSTNTNITRVVLANEVNTALTEVTPYDRGGTNASSLADAKTNFGIPNLNIGTISVNSSGTTNVTIPNNTRALLILCGSSGGMVTVSCNSSGVVSYKDIGSASTLSYSTSTNRLSIANSSTANITMVWLEFANHTLS